MGNLPRRAPRTFSLLLAAISLAAVGVLLFSDLSPRLFPAASRLLFGALPLSAIAVAWLAHHAAQRTSARDWLKAALLAAAFFFWAANQCLRNARAAALSNDIAIALFVVDLVLVIAVRPAAKVQDATPGPAFIMGGNVCCGELICEMGPAEKSIFPGRRPCSCRMRGFDRSHPA